MSKILIKIQNCRIENSRGTVVPFVNWQMKDDEIWLVIGPNGGGKADFLNALSGNLKFVPNEDSQKNSGECFNSFENSVETVSLEKAALIIEDERKNDESDYVEGGVDIGRTGRIFIAEGITGQIFRHKEMPQIVQEIQDFSEVKLCGIEKILDRGLKYMSTGEIRRTLLARALISKKKLLILSDPFAGLDAESRTVLLDFFTKFISKKDEKIPSVILGMERWHEIPDTITHVLEFSNKEISFCGTRFDYENLLKKNESKKSELLKKQKDEITKNLQATLKDTIVLQNELKDSQKEILVEMKNINVRWGNHEVLKNLTWSLKKGEHWLVRGPNGSGKTTFLELITGDNMQVYSNEVWFMGKKRGTGETIWDVKQNLGIVSYRIHVEYRMLGGISLMNVIVSGFRDSIGLYGAATDVEISAAKKWLKLGGFEGREDENFSSLSYGEQRAVLILRSAVKCPPILILDEPCHGLDEIYREKILHLLELIAKNGSSTMLHVTHDPCEVLECEHHILELCPDENPMYKILQK